MNDADPIAYTALEPGTPVRANDGTVIGSVEAVLAVDEVDVFDGLVIRTEDGIRFLDADQVAAIFTTHVDASVSPAEAGELQLPDQDPTYTVDASDDTGDSLSDRFGRMFGRGKWKRER